MAPRQHATENLVIAQPLVASRSVGPSWRNDCGVRGFIPGGQAASAWACGKPKHSFMTAHSPRTTTPRKGNATPACRLRLASGGFPKNTVVPLAIGQLLEAMIARRSSYVDEARTSATRSGASISERHVAHRWTTRTCHELAARGRVRSCSVSQQIVCSASG